jgi:hypothetical protein
MSMPWLFGILYGHLEYFVAIMYVILWLFCTFFPLWHFVPGKIWHPWYQQTARHFSASSTKS